MRIELGAHVRSFDDKDIGRIDKLIIEPESGRLLGAVVREGFILTQDVVIPIDWLQPSTKDEVRCTETADQIRALPAFDEAEFRGAGADEGVLYPSAYPVELAVPAEVVAATDGPDPTRAPQGILVDEEADVIDEAGETVGELRGIIVDPLTGRPDRVLVEGGGELPEDVEVDSAHVTAYSEKSIQLDLPGRDLKGGAA